MPQHFLRSADLSDASQASVLRLAAQLKADRVERTASDSTLVRHDLHGRTVALIFEKPSTRTRVSFQVGVHELGGQPMTLSSSELQLGRGETIADTAAVLSRYCHAIVVRTFGQERVEELAEHASVPVVNALSDLEHPCQALADLQTLHEEFGDIAGRTLAYVGDGNNVAHSLLVAGAKAGVNVRIGHPEGYAPDEAVVADARAIGERTGAAIEITTDPVAAVDGADAVYADVWTSMGQEAENAARLAAFRDHQVTEELMSHAAADAIFLHCLPAHRGEEVTAEVIDGPASRVFDQAENRLHAQKALLIHLLAAPSGQSAATGAL
jgi:ornithine carbamoyltransferase